MLHIREAEHDIEKFLAWFHNDWASAQPGSDICKDTTDLGFDSGSDAFTYHYFHAAGDRNPNRMEHKEIRSNHTPIPHRRRRQPTLTAADPLPADLHEILRQIHSPDAPAH